MKFLYQIFLLGLLLNFALPEKSGEDSPQPRDESVDNYITLVLENFAVAMREGVPVLGIPVLDPFNISLIEIYNFHWKHLKLDANASSIVLQGISYYVPTYVHVEFNSLRIYISLFLQEIDVNGNYWCNGMYDFVFPIFGEGPFDMQVYNTKINGSGGIYITEDNYLQISYLNLSIEFEQLVAHFDNILGGGDFGEQINKALSQLGKLFFDAMMPWVESAVVPAFVCYANKALMQHTIDEIIHGALPTPPSGERH